MKTICLLQPEQTARNGRFGTTEDIFVLNQNSQHARSSLG